MRIVKRFFRDFGNHGQLVVNSLKIYSFSMFGSVLSFGQSILITRALGASAYGVCAASAGLVVLISGFVGFRTAEALAYHIGRTAATDAAGAAKMIRFSIVVDFATTSLAAVVATGFAVIVRLTDGPQVLNPWVVAVYGLSGILSCTANTATALAREERRYWMLASTQAFAAIATFAAVAIVVLADYVSVATVAACSVAGGLIAFLFFGQIILGFMRRHGVENRAPWHIQDILNFRHQHRDFWYFMTCGFWASCLSALVKKSDLVVLGYVASPATVGLYRVAQQGVALIAKGTGAVGTIVIKQFSDFGKNNRIADGVRFGLRLSAMLLPGVLLAFGVIFLYAGPVIQAVYGTEFREATVVFQVLCVGVLWAAAFVWLQPLLLAMNGVRENLVVQIINAVLYFAVLAALAPPYGALGAAIALSSAWITGNVALAGAIYLLYQKRNKS